MDMNEELMFLYLKNGGKGVRVNMNEDLKFL